MGPALGEAQTPGSLTRNEPDSSGVAKVRRPLDYSGLWKPERTRCHRGPAPFDPPRSHDFRLTRRVVLILKEHALQWLFPNKPPLFTHSGCLENCSVRGCLQCAWWAGFAVCLLHHTLDVFVFGNSVPCHFVL